MAHESVILVVDDDDNSLILLEYAFELANVPNPRRMLRSGSEALDYLGGHGIYADRKKYPWPALLLLDLKMPGVSGFEVLEWWAAQKQDRKLPIVVMTSSSSEADVHRAMALGAVAYQVKPCRLEYLVEAVRKLRERWLLRKRVGTERSREAPLT